ncbi:MAG: DUF3944 domain-containing protein, partial [Pseudomonadota bacterium]
MAYREDPDLAFLAHCTSEDLSTLVDILTKDKDGNTRLTENLTIHPLYKQHAPDHREYWPLIAAEIQCFGANTFATLVRGGEGVPYRKVLTNACRKMKVNHNPKADVSIIEMNLLMTILMDSMQEMTTEQLKEIVRDFGIKTTNFTPQAVTAALQAAVAFSGFAAYRIAVIVANAVAKAILGRGLTLAGNAALTRVIG